MLHLYNSRTRAVEPFTPRDNRAVIYVCGITPYDVTHLGHAFTYLTFDVLRRVLEADGVRVQHIQNITDVDDDIIRKARELDTTPAELTERNVAWFDSDMEALGALRAHVYPRVSLEIDMIQQVIGRLVQSGHAYAQDGDVYFSVATWPAFGALSRLSREEMLAENARQNMRPGPRDPLDFLLWQAEAPGEPSWPSPWGPGRPGWHIECTAMALRHGGPVLDIHGGGRDLLFPHHECETTQSEAATGQAPFVRWWAHVGMIRYQGEKMSKSLGNLVLVKNLLKTYSPDAVRLSLLGLQYRASEEWTETMMTTAAERADRLYHAVQRESAPAPDAPTPHERQFRAAIDNDLDTPGAVNVMLDLAGTINAAGERAEAGSGAALRRMGGLLGLRLDRPGLV